MSSAIPGLLTFFGRFSGNFSEHEEELSLRLSRRARLRYRSCSVCYKLFEEVVAKVVQQAGQYNSTVFLKFHF